MPRAKRTPTKAKSEKTEKVALAEEMEQAQATKEAKARKPYPSIDERIALADAKIAQLEKLNATRQALVDKTAALLAERQEVLGKSQSALEKVRARRERLIASKDKPARTPRPRKAAQDPQYQALLSALKEKGTSMEELLASLK